MGGWAATTTTTFGVLELIVMMMRERIIVGEFWMRAIMRGVAMMGWMLTVCYSVSRGGVLAADPTATGTPPPGPAAAIPDAHQSAADMFYYPTSE